MRALRFAAHGGPEVLGIEEVDEPRAPRGAELLVAVAASSINGTDLGLRRGDVPLATAGRLPLVLGFDIAGEVVGCGPAVTGFTPGDRVVALLSHRGGGQAERVLVAQHRAAIAPAGVPPAEAAALPLAGLTALQALRGRAGLHARPAGTRILVLGASGGIGAYAVQLARAGGAVVTGTASARNLDFVTGMGASQALDRQVATPKELAKAGERYDVVLDAHGGAPWLDLRNLLRLGGVAVTTRGVSTDVLVGALARRVPGTTGCAQGRRSLVAVRTAARSYDLSALVALVETGDLRVPLEATFPLADGAAAHAHVESQGYGKTSLVL